MQHKPRIHVFDNPSDPNIIVVSDLSIYEPSLPIINRLLEVHIPGATDIRLVPFPKGKVSTYDSVIFDLFGPDCQSALPDGAYTFRFSIAPNDSLYCKVHHFRTATLVNKILSLNAKVVVECSDGIDDCGNVILTKKQNILLHAWSLAAAAEVSGRDPLLIDWAYTMYRNAESDLRLIEKMLFD